MRVGSGHAITESDLFSQEELERDPFNAEMIGRLGYRWEAGGVFGDIELNESGNGADGGSGRQ